VSVLLPAPCANE